MTDEPIDSLSLKKWRENSDPVEQFGVWYLRSGRWWKFNPVSQSYVTASGPEVAAIEAERAGAPSRAAPVEQSSDGLVWDQMKWQP